MNTLQSLLPDGDTLDMHIPYHYPAKALRRWELADQYQERYTQRERAEVDRLHDKYCEHPTVTRIGDRLESMKRENSSMGYEVSRYNAAPHHYWREEDRVKTLRQRLARNHSAMSAIEYRLSCLLYGDFYRYRNASGIEAPAKRREDIRNNKGF